MNRTVKRGFRDTVGATGLYYVLELVGRQESGKESGNSLPGVGVITMVGFGDRSAITVISSNCIGVSV